MQIDEKKIEVRQKGKPKKYLLLSIYISYFSFVAVQPIIALINFYKKKNNHASLILKNNLITTLGKLFPVK